MVITLGGIIGSNLAGNPALATLPVSLMVVVTAVMAIPATMIMKAIGRRAGSAMASLSASVAVLVAGFAVYASSFAAFILAGALFGINMTFTQQYRYAAAESVQPKFASRAISLVLVGAIGGALIGPELVTRLQFAVPDIQYLGTLIAVAGLYVVQAGLFLILGPMRGEGARDEHNGARPLREITRQPVFLMAVVGGAMSYGVMTFIMTATPLSMHVHDGYSLEVTANVIRWHVLGMYVPSLFTGFLIERFGTVKIMAGGALALLAACLVGLQGQSVMHLGTYGTLALILLGYVILGMFIEGLSLLVITLPIVFPLVTGMGFDPIWLGVVMVIVLEMGLISPPVGVNVFIVKSVVPDVRIETIFAGIMPFWLAMIATLALIVAFPEIALLIPNAMFD